MLGYPGIIEETDHGGIGVQCVIGLNQPGAGNVVAVVLGQSQTKPEPGFGGFALRQKAQRSLLVEEPLGLIRFNARLIHIPARIDRHLVQNLK